MYDRWTESLPQPVVRPKGDPTRKEARFCCQTQPRHVKQKDPSFFVFFDMSRSTWHQNQVMPGGCNVARLMGI